MQNTICFLIYLFIYNYYKKKKKKKPRMKCMNVM